MRYRYEADAKRRARTLASLHRQTYSVQHLAHSGKFYVVGRDLLEGNHSGSGGVVCVMLPDGGILFPNENATETA